MTAIDRAARSIRVDALWTGDGFTGATVLAVSDDRGLGEELMVVAPDSGTGSTSASASASAEHPPLPLGGTLVPALTDHHTHLGLIDPRALFTGGITHAVDLGWIPETAAGWLADVPDRPEVAITGALLTAPGGYPVRSGWAPAGAAEEVGGPRQAADAVRRQFMLGASRIKVALNTDAGETVDDATLAAIVEESHDRSLPVVAHAQGAGQAERAVRAGIDQLAHTPFSERLDDRVIAAGVDAGMTWISTLDIHGWGAPTAAHGIAVDNLRRFAGRGGRVLYGTDLGNGDLPVGVNARELAGLQEAGLSGTRLVRTIAGGDRPGLIGPRVAWVPSAPPPDDADLPAWLATARGLRVADLLTLPSVRQENR